MSHVTVTLPLKLAAALEDGRFVLVVTRGSEGPSSWNSTSFDVGTDPAGNLPRSLLAAALRSHADYLERTARSSADSDQRISAPGAGAHDPAPGAVPNPN